MKDERIKMFKKTRDDIIIDRSEMEILSLRLPAKKGPSRFDNRRGSPLSDESSCGPNLHAFWINLSEHFGPSRSRSRNDGSRILLLLTIIAWFR